MKQIKFLILIVISCLAALIVYSQDSQKPPRWVSDKGYWVVESNINQPLESIVCFYTPDDIMIYKETISGKKLDIRKTSVKMKLKKVLEASVIAWEDRRQKTEEQALVKAIL